MSSWSRGDVTIDNRGLVTAGPARAPPVTDVIATLDHDSVSVWYGLPYVHVAGLVLQGEKDVILGVYYAVVINIYFLATRVPCLYEKTQYLVDVR